jgi:hypothetical protein
MIIQRDVEIFTNRIPAAKRTLKKKVAPPIKS